MPKAIYRLAMCCMRLGQFSEASIHLDRLDNSGRKDPSVRQLEAELKELQQGMADAKSLLDEGKTEVAAHLIESLQGKLRSATPYMQLKARQLLQQKKTDTALTILNAIYMSQETGGSTNTDIMLWRGVALYQSGADAAALKMFQEVLRMDPDNSKVCSSPPITLCLPSLSCFVTTYLFSLN